MLAARFKAFFGIAERFGSKEHFHAAVAERGRVRNFCQHRSITCDRRMRKLVDEWMTRTTQDLTQLDEDLWRHSKHTRSRCRNAAYIHRPWPTTKEPVRSTSHRLYDKLVAESIMRRLSCSFSCSDAP